MQFFTSFGFDECAGRAGTSSRSGGVHGRHLGRPRLLPPRDEVCIPLLARRHRVLGRGVSVARSVGLGGRHGDGHDPPAFHNQRLHPAAPASVPGGQGRRHGRGDLGEPAHPGWRHRLDAGRVRPLGGRFHHPRGADRRDRRRLAARCGQARWWSTTASSSISTRSRCRPRPTEQVPIYLGGESERALRRTARIADGYISVPHSPPEVQELIGTLADLRKGFGREQEAFDFILIDPVPAPWITTGSWPAGGHGRDHGPAGRARGDAGRACRRTAPIRRAGHSARWTRRRARCMGSRANQGGARVHIGRAVGPHRDPGGDRAVQRGRRRAVVGPPRRVFTPDADCDFTYIAGFRGTGLP